MKNAELHCASAFSFLEGASQPEDLVDRAVSLGLPAVALVLLIIVKAVQAVIANILPAQKASDDN